ncbi:MAG: carboxypeptidase-like regulatory domain-containing protein, partial [Candidatus Fervidibacter sp.]|uniref:carboxypeptidase-like regulatory domain-containing protein n=1 Tax=Candidatus Fervidibacter sp. TaxID=3100871 RepID=UPI004049C128
QVKGDLLPVPGALVMLKPPSEGASPENLTGGQLLKRLTFTKADGSFELTGVPAGTYTAIALKPGYSRDEKTVEVKVRERTRVDFVLQAQFATIFGQVTDAVTGQSIKNALVIAVRKGESPIRVGTITDNGNYQLLLPLLPPVPLLPLPPAVDYFVVAVADGYKWQVRDVDGLQAGQTVQVDFALQPSSSIP